MMIISIVTLFPELYTPFLKTSLIARAVEQGLVTFVLKSLFDYAAPKERIDAPGYGPGAGMLLKPDVIKRAVDDLERQYGDAYKVFFSPQGTTLDQPLLRDMYSDIGSRVNGAVDSSTNQAHVMLLPARYEGMDARVEAFYADRLISIGDYVLMGGDLPAMVLLEGLLRLFPGVVGKAESVEYESFEGPFVDYPQYTEPLVWQDMQVPDILRSGNHGQIDRWREAQAAKTSVLEHFDWVRSHKITDAQKKLVMSNIPSHYAVLMHDQVLLPHDAVGTTSVTSLDIHDIARSAKTYGLTGYFIVTPLVDQQKIVRKLLDFWLSDEGGDYNRHRQDALSSTVMVDALRDAIGAIREKHGCDPILIGTSARSVEFESHHDPITFFDQGVVWSDGRPVLLVFGTGRGLAPEILEACDYMLPPVKGFSEFNHLSVRSAAAVVFDRWLGHSLKKVLK